MSKEHSLVYFLTLFIRHVSPSQRLFSGLRLEDAEFRPSLTKISKQSLAMSSVHLATCLGLVAQSVLVIIKRYQTQPLLRHPLYFRRRQMPLQHPLKDIGVSPRLSLLLRHAAKSMQPHQNFAAAYRSDNPSRE